MPKHNKKVKSDRINELRKQYDAFLEEDKKRKDRNEFILGRLEKMRLGTAPDYHKKITALNESSYQFLQRSQLLNQISGYDETKSIIKSQRTPLYYKKNLEDSDILKEVSKNFILIPKLQPKLSNNSNYYIPAVQNVADTDWKSKYNILDELKKNEKETTLEENINFFGSNEYHNTSKCEEPPALLKCNVSVDGTKEAQTTCSQNKDNRSLSDKEETREIKSYTIQANNNKDLEKNIDIDYNEDKDKEINIISENTIQCGKSKENGIPDNSKRVDIQDEIYRQTINEPANENCGDHNIVKNYIPTTVLSQPEIEKPLDNKPETGESNCNIDMMVNPQETHIDYDNNTKDDRALEEHNIQEDNYNEDLQQQMVPPINNEITINKDLETSFENNDIFSNTTEQYESNNVENEEYRNEEPNKFEADHETAYPAGENNYIPDQENNQIENYIPENQQHTNEYTYYNEAEQEQPYGGEIDEHVETTEHFDPTYEQQYMNNYEDPAMMQYQDQQYEVENELQQVNNDTYDNNITDNTNYEYVNNEAIDQGQHVNAYNEIKDQNQYENNVDQEDLTEENEQHMEQVYYEQETVNNIQNQLDAEDGFKEHINPNIQNIEEQIVNADDTEHGQAENVNFVKPN